MYLLIFITYSTQMKKAQQEVSTSSCHITLELDSHEIWYNHEWWVAIDTSDESLLRMMIDTGLVRKDNTLSIYFDHEWDMMTNIVSYKKIKTIQHNQNDYTFIFLN